MNVAIISFTKAGSLINAKVTRLLKPVHSCDSYYKGRCDEAALSDKEIAIKEVTAALREWCGEIFYKADGIIFVGACGIAVRTIAPFIQDKTKDPLVLVIDEKASYVISLLSGHIGGGNELTLTISELLKAAPVITTATDVNQTFAVDVFAKKENLYINDMQMAKEISASILEGKKIGLFSRLTIDGNIPEELVLLDESGHQNEMGICISLDEKEIPFSYTLNLIPNIVTLGVGCKKNTDINQFEAFMLNTLKENHISIHAVKSIASIDLKENEPCIRSFAEKYKLNFLIYSADELKNTEGEFQESEFVKSITGVGNVCERSAILGGSSNTLLLEKQSYEGMTIAIAKEMRGIRFE
jgi:cobalt-precorrin 5A hydrolase